MPPQKLRPYILASLVQEGTGHPPKVHLALTFIDSSQKLRVCVLYVCGVCTCVYCTRVCIFMCLPVLEKCVYVAPDKVSCLTWSKAGNRQAPVYLLSAPFMLGSQRQEPHLAFYTSAGNSSF